MNERIFCLPILVMLSLAGCSGTPPRQGLPPVVEGGAPSSEPAARVGVPRGEEPVVVSPPQSGGGAVVALLERADDYRRSGDVSGEAATIERALRIEPNNARLWSRLAEARLEQGQPRQAEQLALKSNGLATGDRALQAHNWRLVARARWALDDAAGARAAEQRARSLDRR